MSARLPNSILFDLDGTIIHSLPGIEHSVRAAFESCQISLGEIDLGDMIGPPISEILATAGQIDDQAALDALVTAFRHNYDSEGWLKTKLYSGVMDVLGVLDHADYRLFVVSNKPKHIAIRILEHLNIARYFEAVVTRDSRSPAFATKAQMMRALANERRFDLKNALAVGDTMEDAEAGAEVGASFAFVASGYGQVPLGGRVPVFLRLDSLTDLLPLMATEPVHDR